VRGTVLSVEEKWAASLQHSQEDWGALKLLLCNAEAFPMYPSSK